jgi:hypothetical protein
MAQRAATMGFPFSGSTVSAFDIPHFLYLTEIFGVASEWHLGITSVYPIK